MGPSDYPGAALRPERPQVFKPFDGATVHIRPWRFVSQPSGVTTLTNVYEAAFRADRCRFGIFHSSRPRPLPEMLAEAKPAVFMNAGFLLVADVPVVAANPAYHLQVAAGRLLGLHSNGRTALVEKDGRLRTEFVPAAGWLRLGSVRLDWVGCREPDKPSGSAVVFGPQDQGLLRDASGIRLDESRATVPARRRHLNVAFHCRDGRPTVAAVTLKAVPILGAAFIVQAPASLAGRLRVGDQVNAWRVGPLMPANTDAAVTVNVSLPAGPNGTFEAAVRERAVITRRAEDGLPFFPARLGQKARTCILEDAHGRVVFLLFDARPAQAGQRGLTLVDLAAHVRERYSPRWAVVCDGGQSARLCCDRAGRRLSFGNRHYLDLTGAAPRWIGDSGRAVNSAVFARPARVGD